MTGGLKHIYISSVCKSRKPAVFSPVTLMSKIFLSNSQSCVSYVLMSLTVMAVSVMTFVCHFLYFINKNGKKNLADLKTFSIILIFYKQNVTLIVPFAFLVSIDSA